MRQMNGSDAQTKRKSQSQNADEKKKEMREKETREAENV